MSINEAAPGPPIAKGRLDSSQAPYHYTTFLWATQEDYERVAGAEKGGTRAMCITDTWVCERTGAASVQEKLGEIHFVSGTWSLGTVAHEVTHALLHRLRYLDVTPGMVLPELSSEYDLDGEEVLAYEAGNWVESLYEWLSRHDGKRRSESSLTH